MEKIQLSLLFKIIGIGSASGLVYHEDKLYLISDNSTFLYEYNIPNESLNKIALVENAQENIPKKEKADLEAITKEDNKLILLGSGSTEKRNALFTYHLNTKKIKAKDFTETYKKIKSQLFIQDEELNIEGLLTKDETIYLFQRGNGLNAKNGIILSADDEDEPNFRFVSFTLPKIKNVEATFTDAVLVDTTIYFLAAAEDTHSTYHDGEVLGSLIGTIDLHTMELGFTQQITDEHKFEGLTLYKKSDTELEFLLCDDNDSDVLESSIYKLVLKK